MQLNKVLEGDWTGPDAQSRGRAENLVAFPKAGDIFPHRLDDAREFVPWDLLSLESHKQSQERPDREWETSKHYVSGRDGCSVHLNQ